MLRVGLVLLFCLAVASSRPIPLRASLPKAPAADSALVSASWEAKERDLDTIPTFQVVVNPLLERSSPIHKQVFQSLSELKTQHIRFVPWLPYPKLAVAELEPSTNTTNSWNFVLLDALMEDFMNAAGNSSVIINFSTPPTWLYNTSDWSFPQNPDDVTWDYEKGTELLDKTASDLAAYYSRLLSHYTQGGFTDEQGVFHPSPYRYNIQAWEVLNEVEAEHHLTPQSYTTQYDAVTRVMKAAHKDMEFVGLALAYHHEWDWYEYFLNASNHAAGTPLDWISYHFYASSQSRDTPTDYEEFFPAADDFVTEVEQIEKLRKSLSPSTRTTIDEVGVILPDDNTPHSPPPKPYWAAAGGMYAYLFIELSKLGIDVLGESQLVGHPKLGDIAPQFPSVTMLDWNTGFGNARFHVLKLLLQQIDNQKNSLVPTTSTVNDVAAQGFLRADGRKWMVAVNKRYSPIQLTVLADAIWYQAVTEDVPPSGPAVQTASAAAGETSLEVTLPPFATLFINIGKQQQS